MHAIKQNHKTHSHSPTTEPEWYYKVPKPSECSSWPISASSLPDVSLLLNCVFIDHQVCLYIYNVHMPYTYICIPWRYIALFLVFVYFTKMASRHPTFCALWPIFQTVSVMPKKGEFDLAKYSVQSILILMRVYEKEIVLQCML